MKRKILAIIFLLLIVSVSFAPFAFQNKLPIPSDTIVGLYHPFRDLYSKDYPNGVPYKNFLITDPVRQQYPWRNLVIDLEKRFELPLWNPYNFAGSPFLANFQSATFYPLNFLFFIFPFATGWGLLIFLQPLLAGVFLYLYLVNLKLNRYSAILGAISFALSGFSIAWFEWGTIGHTALWLPLLLLSIDKISPSSADSKISNFKFQISNKQIKVKKYLVWELILLFSLTSSFFAGHLQVFFYLFIVSLFYFFLRWWQFGQPKNIIKLYIILNALFLILTVIQWYPTLQLVLQSARGVDQIWQRSGWFIPWQNMIQFVAPDFFGNPATLNYWGEFNYAEFIGYIGIFPLLMGILALTIRREREVFFFGSMIFLSVIFSFPTFFAKIPYILQIPFLSTTQPTRLLFLTDFGLSILAGFGLDALMRKGKKINIVFPAILIAIVLFSLWYFVFAGHKMIPIISYDNILVAKRNLYLPTIIFTIVTALILAHSFSKNKIFRSTIVVVLLIVTVIDLLRFANKFTPFTISKYLFPQTKALNFLQKQQGQFRIMTADDRILPPNFSTIYRLQGIDGYDPLYLLRYGELIAASERGRPDISSPFGFNRIITPHNINSRLVDLLGVEYVLSLDELNSPKLEKIFAEGQTKIYKNNSAFPRVFLVKNVKSVSGKQDAINALFDTRINLKETAIVEKWDDSKSSFASGSATIVEYRENSVTVSVKNNSEAFLVLVDTFYPTWHAKVCLNNGNDCQYTEIYLTNYNFRGVKIPKGEHNVVFDNSLL